MKKAVFLDRDGTINEDVGDLYEIQNVRFIPGAIEAMKRLAKEFSLFIVTNQSGIGKGVFDLEQYGVFEREYNVCCGGRPSSRRIAVRTGVDQPCVCLNFHYTAASERHGIDYRGRQVTIQHTRVEMPPRTVTAHGHGERHKGELVIPPDHIAGNLAEAASDLFL